MCQCRQAKIKNLYEVFAPAAGCKQDVVALQVAVHDAQIVCASESGAHLFENIDAPLDWHGAACELRGQRSADEILHYEVKLAIVRFADIVNIDDVCVVDSVCGPGFAQHPSTQMRLAAEVGSD